jgi:hypothetical protein
MRKPQDVSCGFLSARCREGNQRARECAAIKKIG